uniref:Ig-like domain-containing protein n=1 Tax=Zosterops lateralis melanops TaxID=1220523 RepID=A0A8D2PDP0_ZOSLA
MVSVTELCPLSPETLKRPYPGGSLTQLCRGSGFDFESHTLYWLRQSPEGEMELLAGIYGKGSTYYAESVQGRVSISRDNEQSSVTLTMIDLKDEDSGTYFSVYRFLSIPKAVPPAVPSCPQSSPGVPSCPQLSPAVPGCPQVSPKPRPFPQTSAPAPGWGPLDSYLFPPTFSFPCPCPCPSPPSPFPPLPVPKPRSHTQG